MSRIKAFGLFTVAFYLTALGYVFHGRGMVGTAAALGLIAYALMGRLIILARQT